MAGVPGPFEVVLVVEGAARETEPIPGVRVVAAAGSGDNAIVDVVRAAAGERRHCVVVTADRDLRDRVSAVGAEVRGPAWLYGQLSDQ